MSADKADGLPGAASEPKLEIKFRPRVSVLASIIQMIEAFGSATGVPEQHTFLINLAMDELVTNYVRHSLGKVKEPWMEMELRHLPKMLRLTLIDTGPPFDPRTAGEPDLKSDLDTRQVSGVGLHLLRDSYHRLNYTELENGCNRIVLERDIEDAGKGAAAV